jgi:D-tyrosyl-tRNA(Tyr) deacylase
MDLRYLVILSDPDPVAQAVRERWGPGAVVGEHVDGAPIRSVGEGVASLRRPGRHVLDDALDARLPPEFRAARVPLVFPSIHRSERGPLCLTVHPLGNWGDRAEVGGAPRRLVPSAPRLMTAALRALTEGAEKLGLGATYESTHHGPSLDLPAFFAEIGGGPNPDVPPAAAADLLAEALRDLVEDPADRIALGVGGGHYVPHFTELALERRWAFGHLLPRHTLPSLGAAMARAAWEATPGAEGIVFARAADAELPVWEGIGPRRKDTEAPRRV